MNFTKAHPVKGITLPRRRFTGWAALYFAGFVCAPIMALALLLDIISYVIFTRFLERCYGLLCLFY